MSDSLTISGQASTKALCWNRAGDFKQVLKKCLVMILLSAQIDAPLLLFFPAVLLFICSLSLFVILFLSLFTFQWNYGFICFPCPPINLSSLRVEIMGCTLHSLMPQDNVLMKRKYQSLSQIEVALLA